jgi:hypothetical protein
MDPDPPSAAASVLAASGFEAGQPVRSTAKPTRPQRTETVFGIARL